MDKKQRRFAAIAIITVIAAASLIFLGIATLPQPAVNQTLTSIVKDGVEYVFNSNIYDAVKIPLNDKEIILDKLALANHVWILFYDNVTDNPYIAAASVGLTSKLVHYYAYSQGRLVNVTGIELSGAGNQTIEGTFIEFLGPNTGANETSVGYRNGIIAVQALNATQLQLVADRLALVLFEDELRALNVTIPVRQ